MSDFFEYGRAVMFAEVQDDWQEIRRGKKAVAEYRLDPLAVERGNLVPCSSIIGESPSVLAGRTSCSHTFSHLGSTCR